MYLLKNTNFGRKPWSSGYLWDKTHVLKVVGSNLSTVYWMDVFHISLLKKCNVCLKKIENKRKRGRGWPIKNIQITDDLHWDLNYDHSTICIFLVILPHQPYLPKYLPPYLLPVPRILVKMWRNNFDTSCRKLFFKCSNLFFLPLLRSKTKQRSVYTLHFWCDFVKQWSVYMFRFWCDFVRQSSVFTLRFRQTKLPRHVNYLKQFGSLYPLPKKRLDHFGNECEK